ncbi:bifunctional 2-polyprenyl-6-hydroxyphenol methylase/3-demethylubiquinol 3-O-methyltransferase UbiG [uncultured Methanobrevibacter sp.]|uniref:class I SAM-dependent methyltransferase n=1 Tax=uncultured Methanobrevibacter sp. TaxID=253161 RepID=UPI0025ECA699|nr:class I SAM-dependent methyltransferase [uncultured Methanobrevibacter sp.]
MVYNRLYECSEMESKIKDIVNDDEDFLQVIKANNYFEYYYFLSNLRHDLFNWYPFKKNADLLEIGSGYGQLTEFFSNKVKNVVAVENSESKAEIIKKRVTNANVIVSDFDKLNLNKKFDYIILCNIFEYAKSFFESKEPYKDYLNYLKGFLKEDGVILIALSNRLGLKYFAGFKEEHTNEFFIGVDGYNNISHVETFSKPELLQIIEDSEFSNYKFFYPYPDHEFPKVINTDKFLYKIPYLRQADYFDERADFFREDKLNLTFTNDNLADYFANSFLIEIRNSNNKYESDNINYVKINSNRAEKFRTSTVINSNGVVYKYPLNPNANEHIKKMYENSKASIGKIKFLKSDLNDNVISYELLNEKTLEDLLVEAIEQDNKKKFFKILKKYYNALFYNSTESNDYMTDEFISVFNYKSKWEFHHHDKANLDLIFNNIFIINNEFIAIDYEWFFDFPIPLEFIFFRVLTHHINTNQLIGDYISVEEVFKYFDIETSVIRLFEIWESNFIKFVYGYPNAIPKPDRNILSKYNLELPEKTNEYIHLYLNQNDSSRCESLRKDIVVRQRKMINELSMKNDKLSKDLAKKRKEVYNKNKTVKNLQNSFSWKITKPIRKLKSKFK